MNLRRTALSGVAGLSLLASGVGLGVAVSAGAAEDPPVVVTRQSLAEVAAPPGAPKRTLGLSKVVVMPGAVLASHHHPGAQLGYVAEGVLTYTVESGSARLGRTRGQAAGHRQAVHQGQDRIAEVVLPGRPRPDVLDQPRPVRPDGTPDGGCCFGRAGHVMQAVESQDEVIAVAAGQILRPRGPEFRVLQSAFRRPAAGTFDRVL